MSIFLKGQNDIIYIIFLHGYSDVCTQKKLYGDNNKNKMFLIKKHIYIIIKYGSELSKHDDAITTDFNVQAHLINKYIHASISLTFTSTLFIHHNQI